MFDLDGTVVDAFRDIQTALNHALAASGLPGHDMQTVRRFVGNGLVKLCERAVPAGARESLPAVIAATAEYYAAHPADHATVYPGVREALEALRHAGWRTAVLSNKPDALVQLIADRLELRGLFDAVAGENEGQPMKPDPAGLLTLGQRLAARHIVVVGDGVPDAQLAERAGAGFVGVTWGTSAREVLAPFGEVVDSAEELPAAVERARARLSAGR